MLKLTKKEIADAVRDRWVSHHYDAVQEALLRKVWKWGEERCEGHVGHHTLENRGRHYCPLCWQALLQEAGKE